MKTKLPTKIDTWEEGKAFLKELHSNGESYHPEDDAFGICWATAVPLERELHQLNRLMDQIYALPEFKDYPNVKECPCGFLLDLDKNKEDVHTDS